MKLLLSLPLIQMASGAEPVNLTISPSTATTLQKTTSQIEDVNMVVINGMTTQFSMDAIFTPPSPCSTSWTFEPEGANSVESGLIIQNAVTFASFCFPSGFDHVGRMQGSLIYSPGWCPIGYTSADVAIDGPVTTAICCPSYVHRD
jgi:hypothetical protein